MATRDRRINTEHKCRGRSDFFRPTNCIRFGLCHSFHANSEILELVPKVVSSGILARRQIPARDSTELGDFPGSRRNGNNSEESRWRGIKLTSGCNNFTGAFYTNEIYVSLSFSSIWTSARCFSTVDPLALAVTEIKYYTIAKLKLEREIRLDPFTYVTNA